MHAVSVVVEVEASEVIPAALPESLNVAAHAVGVACALFLLPTVP